MSESNISKFITLAGGVVVGVPFGATLNLTQMATPKSIRAQMAREDWAMAKVFGGAVAVGSTYLGALHALGVIGNLPVKKPPIGSLVTGAAILGVGMAMGGACPGTIWSQAGSGEQDVLWSALGTGAGALAYGVLHESLQKVSWLGQTAKVSGTVYGSLGVPYSVAAFGMAGIAGLAVLGLEKLFPEPFESKKTGLSKYFDLSLPRIHPFGGALVIGLLQVGSVLFVGNAIGTSSAFITILGHAVESMGLSKTGYMQQHTHKLSSYFQLIQDIGMVIGGYVAANVMRNPKQRETAEETTTVDKAQNFLGGFLLLFGARLANGCTSGHGLSGSTLLAWSGLVASGVMFASGMAASAVGKAMFK